MNLKKKLDKNMDINMGGNKIISYRNPNDLNGLVNKSYVDQNLSKYLPIDKSLAMRGELSLGSNALTDLTEPKYSNDATTKNYVDNALNSKIDKTLSSDLDLNNNKITNLKKATQNKDAVNLVQVNEANSVISSTTERLFLKKGWDKFRFK